MPKIIAAFILSLFCVSANAKEVEKLDVNCDTVDIDVGNSDGFIFYALVKWEYPAVFPDLPRKIVVGDKSESGQVGFEFECPTLSARYDGDKLTVKADTVEDALGALTSKYYPSFDLYFYGWYDYPYIKRGYNTIKYGINLYDYSLEVAGKRVSEGQVLSRLDFRGMSDDVVVGYKVDGGNLKPIIYNSEVNWYTGDMADANVIDIYHKNNDSKFNRDEKLQRIHIDKSKGLVEFYKKSPFPSS